MGDDPERENSDGENVKYTEAQRCDHQARHGESKKTQTPTQYNNGRNLYMATWRSLTTAPKQTMEKYSQQRM